MEYFHLMRLYKFSQTNLVPTNYLKGVAGDTTLWRQVPRLTLIEQEASVRCFLGSAPLLQ